MKKLLKSFLNLFSTKFIHPAVNEELAHAIHDKLNRRRKQQEEESQRYNDILNGYLRTYFSTSYADSKEMSIAFDLTNKKWKDLCKRVNRSNKLINIKKDAFSDRVKLTLDELYKSKNN